MPQSHTKTRTPSQLTALLARVAALVVEERIPRALRLIQAIECQPLEPAARYQCLAHRADCYLASRQFAELQALLVELGDMARDDVQRIHMDLIDAHWRVLAGSAHEAVRLVARAVRTLGPHDERRARAMRIVGVACYRTGHYHWSKQCFQAAAAFYRLHDGTPGLIHCLNSLSLVMRSEGHLVLALSHLDDAMRYLPQRGFSKTRMRLLINRGICLLKLGRLAEARSMFMGAKARAATTDRVYQVMVLNNLGHTYRLQGNLDVAKEFHRQALELARQAGSDRQVGLSLEFLGEVYVEEGDGHQALERLNEAHTIARRVAAQGDVMMEVLRRRGEAQVLLGNSKAAAEDLERAIRLCGSRGEKREAVLARRAYWFLKAVDVQELATRVQGILEELEQLDDRFEYARTVYLALKDGRLDPEHLPWLVDATVAATHYFTTLGSRTWKMRLQEVAGPRRRISRSRGNEDSLREYRITSRSPRFAATLEAVRIAARSPLPALIIGETGVGKEVIAELLHGSSSRASAPLTAINCGALPENLVESELFGYAQGAYTGATKEKPGLFEAAHHGTVLLDEVGDMPPLAQVKLLRFLDTGEVRRVGELRPRRCDVRVLASTNRDLGALVQEGKFRTDLLFRLAAFRIVVPPLRERPEDTLELARFFLREVAQGAAPPTLSAELEGWMLGYEWPGNVRELRNLCGYLHARSWGRNVVQVSDLPPELQRGAASSAEGMLAPFERDLVEFERARLVKALKESRGNISGAARLLGMSRNTVSQRMRKFGLQRSSFEV